MPEEKNEVVEIEENKKWTFGNYFKGIKKFKWWVLGFTVFGTVAGYLSFKFILNPARKKLTATCTFELPGAFDEGSTDVFRFVDGSSFSPSMLISKSNLQSVKDGNEKYKKVNIDNLVEKNNIGITKDMTLMNQDEKKPVYYITYKISATASSFPSDKVGQQFVFDVLNSATIISANAVDNYSVIDTFTSNFETLDFSRKIAQIKDQYQAITTTFNKLGEDFNKSTVASASGEKLYEIENKVKSNYAVSSSKSFADELRGTLDSNKYTDYDPAKKAETIANIKALCIQYAETKAKKENEKANYEAQIANLKIDITIQQDIDYTKKITELAEKISEVTEDINDIVADLNNYGYVDGTIWRDDPTDDTVLGRIAKGDADWISACAAFKAKLSAYKASLDADRVVTSEAYRFCYKSYKNYVSIQNGGYVKVDGAISSVIGLAAGLAVGFIASSLITAAIYIYKKED